MRIYELDNKIKSVRNWNAAQADAEEKGLSLFKNGKSWFLQPKNYNEISAEMKNKGIPWTDYYDMLTASLRNIREYSAAADKIANNMGELPQIIANVANRKQTKAYEELQRIQEESMNRKPHSVPQLFVPRPQINTEKPDWYYRRVGYRFDDDGNRIRDDNDTDIVKESRPLLSPAPSSPGQGGNKPLNSFWTSSLKKEYTEDGVTYYGSEWVDYVCNNQPRSYSNIGYVYKINPSARILTIRDTHDAKRIYQLYRELGASLSPNAEYRNEHYDMVSDFPWNDIRKHWDAVHHTPSFGDHYGFMFGYDCESTVWFNATVLEYIGKVKIRDIEKDKDYWDRRND